MNEGNKTREKRGGNARQEARVEEREEKERGGRGRERGKKKKSLDLLGEGTHSRRKKKKTKSKREALSLSSSSPSFALLPALRSLSLRVETREHIKESRSVHLHRVEGPRARPPLSF